MPIGGGNTVGTGFVPIKPDTDGFGNELERGLDREGGPAASRAGQKISKVLKGAFLGEIALIGKGVLDFAGFDKGMREVFTLMPDITAPAMDAMTQQVKDFSSEFGVLPTETVPALYEALGAGIPAGNVFEFLETAQKLAKGGVTDLTTAVDGLSSVVNAYGADIVSAEQASDIMFTTVKLGKGTVDEVAGSLFNVTPIAAAMGVSFNDVGAALAVLTAQGTPVSVAATQIRGVIGELGKSGTKASGVFEAMTGKTFPQFIAEGGDLSGALKIMQQAADDGGLSLIDMFGSIEAGQAALGLAKGDFVAFDGALGAMGTSAGATDAAFETMNVGLAATMDRLKAKFSVSLLNLGETLAPQILAIGEALAGLVDMFSALPAPMQTGIILFATLGTGVLAFAGPMLKVVKLGGEMSKVFSLLAANPWALAILALVAAGVLLYKNWDTIKAKVGGAIDWINGKFKMIKKIWAPLIDGDWFGVGEVVDNIFGNNGTFIRPIGNALQWVEDRFNGVQQFFSDWVRRVQAVFDSVVDLIRPGLEAVAAIWSFTFNAMSTFFESWVGRLGALFDSLTNWATTAFTALRDFVTPIWDAMWGAMLATVNVVWPIVQTIIATGASIVRGAISQIAGPVQAVMGAFVILQGVAAAVWDKLKSIIDGAVTFLINRINDLKRVASDALGPLGSIVGFAGKMGGKAADLLGFAGGGVVPGPIGAPQLAVVHGGETILPVATQHLGPGVAAGNLDDPPGGGIVIPITMNVSSEVRDPGFFERQAVEMTRVISRELDRQRRAEGAGTKGIAA